MADEQVPAGQTPPAQPAAIAAPAFTPQTMPAAPATPPAATAASAAATEDGGAGDEPRVIGQGGAAIPPEAISKLRIAEREKARKEMMAELGITDPAAFKAAQEAQAKELKRLKTEEDKRKRDAMSEQDKLKADLEAEKQARLKVEGELTTMRNQQTLTQQIERVNGIASKHVRPSLLKAAGWEFTAYLKTITAEERAELDDKDIDKWFKDLVKENADYAPLPPVAADGETPPAKPPPAKLEGPKIVRRPVTTGRPLPSGTPPQRPAADPLAGKTFRSGQKNSMTREEVKEATSKMGLKYPA